MAGKKLTIAATTGATARTATAAAAAVATAKQEKKNVASNRYKLFLDELVKTRTTFRATSEEFSKSLCAL
jgi:hypothetical protein